jgi:hypothetical protein
MVEPDELQATQLKFEIAAAGFQRLTILARPFNGGEEVLALFQLREDVVHRGELLANLSRGYLVEVKKATGWFRGGGGGGGIVGVHHGFLFGDFGEEGGCDGELAFAEEVHGDGTVYEVFLFGEDIVLGAREGSIFEELGGGCC